MMQERKMAATVRYLELRGNEVVDTFGNWAVFEDGCLVFAKVSIGESFAGRAPSQREFERVAIDWLVENDLLDREIRCDHIEFAVVANGRAMVKHTTDCLNA